MEKTRLDVELQKKELSKLRSEMGMNRKVFAEYFSIPLRTIEEWEAGRRKMPEYLLRLMSYKVQLNVLQNKDVRVRDEEETDRNIQIIFDEEGRKIVLINDIRFKGKERAEWDEIETYLKEYVGRYYEIAETAEKVYVGKEFPNEFAHAKDRLVLKGPNAKAKANASQIVGELIQIATNKTSAPDYRGKHGSKAQYGWYRYDTRLALPVYDNSGDLVRYNIFKMRMLVRHDKDGKMYLYDFLRTKKETSSPL